MLDGNSHLSCWVWVHSLRGVRSCERRKPVGLSGKIGLLKIQKNVRVLVKDINQRQFITARKRSFYTYLSFCSQMYPSMHWGRGCLPRGWQTPPWADTHPWADTPRQRHPLSRHPLGKCRPPPPDGHWSGWYTSCWNEFLFKTSCTPILCRIVNCCYSLRAYSHQIITNSTHCSVTSELETH